MRLRGVLLDGVGYPEARFTPLRLDLTDGVAAVDSVVWLDNGGGKTSLSSLVFNVLRPDRREFIARLRDDYQLEHYVLDSDTAHVALCFEVHPPDRTVGHQLVVGQVLEWRDRRATPGDVTRLQRSFYCFQADPGVLDLDSLPIVDDTNRRRSLRTFTERLRETAAAHPGIDMVVAGDQATWLRELQRRHVDPELLRHQVLMNSEEGGATELLSFGDVWDFADLLVELLVTDEELSGVRRTVDRLREKWDRQAGNRAELELCEQAVPALESAAATLRRRDEAAAALAEQLDQAALLRDQLAAAVTQDQVTQAALEARVDELDQEIDTARTNVSRLENSRQQARYESARLQAEDLEQRHELSRDQADQATATADAWELVEVVQQHAAARTRVDDLQRRVDDAEAEADPVRRAVERAEGDLAARLVADRTGHAEAAAAAESRAAELRAQAASGRERLEELTGLVARDTQRLEAADEAVRKAEALHDEQTGAGRIEHGESAAAAAARWGEAVEAARTDRTAADATLTRLVARRQDAQDRLTDAGTELARLGEQHKAATATVRALQSRRDLLASDELTVELCGGLTPSLPRDAAELLASADGHTEVLSEAVGEHEGQVAALTQRLERLGDDGVEVDDDVRSALDLLHHAGVSAVAGWEYLARAALDSARRRAVLLADPEAASGVVLTAGPDDLDRARDALVDLVPGVPVVVAPQTGLRDTPDDRRLVLAPAAERYDPDAAAALAAALADRLNDHRQQLAEASVALQARRDLAARVRRWLDDGGRTLPEAIERLATIAEALAAREQDVDRATAELAQLADEHTTADGKRRDADQRLDTASTNVTALDAAVRAAAHADRLRGEVAAARTRLKAWDLERTELTEQVTQADDHAREHDRRAAEQRVLAGAIADDADELAVTLDDAVGDATLPARTTLRVRLLDARAQLRAVTPDPELAELAERARTEVAALASRLADEDDATTSRARDLAATADAGRPAALRQARSRARERARELQAAQGRLEGDAARARATERQRAPQGRAHFADLSEHGPLRTVADATALAEAFDEQVERERGELEGLRATRDEAADAVTQAAARAQLLAGQRDRITDALARHGTGDRATDPDTAVYTGTPDQASEAVAVAARSLDQATGTLTELDGAAEHDHQALVALGEAHPDAAAETRLALDRRTGDTDGCRALLADLQLRVRHLTDELASAAKQRELTIKRLEELVRDILTQMRKVERLSRIPDTIEQWAGRPFIRIRHTDPDPGILRDQVAGVVEDCLVDQAVPGGRQLALRTLKRVLGHDGLHIDLLKPTDTMEPKRQPVDAFAASDGQKLTAAILLYCTIARTRFDKLGLDPDLAGGMLWLDNPFGKATKLDLVDLQRQVAAKMGVQLVYLTGVKDYDAVEAFTRLESLRKATDPATGHTHVVPAHLYRKAGAA